MNKSFEVGDVKAGLGDPIKALDIEGIAFTFLCLTSILSGALFSNVIRKPILLSIIGGIIFTVLIFLLMLAHSSFLYSTYDIR
jgi:hypothetical protein